MRWFVEISPLGASEGQKQKWCLEAAGWQPALKEARALRGEEGPLGGFSIELLDDGARAVDPASRTRYVIRSAPDGAPLTHPKDGPVKADAPAVSAKGGAGGTDAAKAEAPRSDLVKKEATPTDLVKPEARSTDLVKPEPHRADLVKPEAHSTDLVKPEPHRTDLVKVEPAEPAKPADDSDDVDVPVDEDDAPPPAPAPSAPITPAAPAQEIPTLPAFLVLQSRDEEPSERSPLTYREQVLVVDAATPDAEIERLLRARLDGIREALASTKSGRFVNLAVFDHAFTGKPSRRPRATLTWKDWRGVPEIRFPAAERASLEPPSFAAPTSLSMPVPQPSIPPQSVAPITALAPTEPAPDLHGSGPSPAAAVPAPAPLASPAPPPSTRPAAPEAPAAPAVSVKPEPDADAPAVSAIPKTKPAATSAPAPASSRAASRSSAPPPPRKEAFVPSVKSAPDSRRMSGDDLISDLFDACGDLQFLRDSLEGADFVLNLALEKLPSELGLVSLFDINRREFVVVRQAGGPAAPSGGSRRSIVLARLPERAGLAQAAMRKRAAIVVADASKEPRVLDDRFRALGLQLASYMVAPVEVSGRYLGLLELCNPVDGKAFTEGDGNALTYIGEQFAEFVAERGVVLDPDTVLERHQRP